MFIHALLAVMLIVSVHDSSGQPVGGARVQLSTTPVQHVTTNSRGRATFRIPSPAPYVLRIEANGYKTVVRTLPPSDQKAINVVLLRSAGALQVIGSVTGHAMTPFNASPVATRVFPREAYRDQGQSNSETIINQTPGALALSSLNVNAGAVLPPAFPSVRNALPFETALSIDGEPVLAPNGTMDLSLMPTFMLEGVEIVKNPAAGAINFRTADPTLGQRGTYELEGDSHGGSFTDLAYDGTEPGGAFAYAGMIAADDSGGCCAPDPSGEMRKDALVKLREIPSSGLTITATAMSVSLNRSFEATYGLPGYGYEHLGFADLTAALDRGDDAYSAHLYTMQTAQDADLAPNPFVSNEEDATGESFDWVHAAESASFDSGARSASGTIPGTALGETRSSIWENVTLHPGKRSELDLDGDLASDRTSVRNFNANGAHLGYAYSLNGGLALRAAYGTNGVFPALSMLPGDAGPIHGDVGETERMTGTDEGVEWRLHGDTTTLSADVYRTATHGVYFLNGFAWSNGPPMVESGEEFTLQQFKRVGMGFIAAMSFPRTYVWGGAPQFTDANVGYGEVAPYRIPYAQGYAELSYKWPHGSRLSIGALYVGSNNAYGAPAFETLNSNLELSLGPRAKLQFSVQNLTDALADRVPVYFVPTPSYGLQPFTLRFMFRQSFGTGSLYEH